MEEEDDFEIVETGLIFLGNNRYDIYEIYEKEDNEGDCFFYGIYEIKNRGFISSRADSKEELSTNLSCIAKMRKRGIHRLVGAKVRMRNHWLYLN